MPSRKLTTTAIPHLAEGEWYDLTLPGLVLRVGKKRRSWTFRYHSSGSYHRKPLGHFPAMELAAARNAGRRLLDALDRGAPLPPPELHPRSPGVLTLGALLDQYEAMRLREGVRIRTFTKTMRLLRHHLGSHLALPAADFSKAELRNIRNELVAAGTAIAANRLLGTLGPVLRWAAQEDLVAANFVPAIRRSPEPLRARVLTPAEIGRIWRACEELGPDVSGSYGRLVRFLLLTAQRLGEAASLRHGDILDGTWKQVANKSSRPHSLPLPPLALGLIGHGEARALVFPGRAGKIGALSRLKRRLDQASGVTGWRVHDLRRSAASSMQDLEIRNEIVQAILNHAVPGVGGVYLRSELEKQKAEALATWANALERIVGSTVQVSA